MSLLGILSIVVQVYFAVHAARTGRFWWVLIVLLFPFIGALIYFLVEYLPEMQADARIRQTVSPVREPGISELERELEATDSLTNRVRLAEAYFNAARYDDAIALLERSLVGVHAADPEVLEGLCFSYLQKGDAAKAKEYLARLEQTQEGKESNHVALVKARVLEAVGEIDAALREYKYLADRFGGEEARCRYALLLKRTGDVETARELFKEILSNAEQYPKQYMKFQKQWVDIARAEV